MADSLAAAFIDLKDAGLKPILLAAGVPMHGFDLYANDTRGILFRHDPMAAINGFIVSGADGLGIVACALSVVTTDDAVKSWDATPHFTSPDNAISYVFRDCVYEAADVTLEGNIRIRAFNSFGDIVAVPPTDGLRWVRKPHKDDGLLLLPLALALRARKSA